jgi:flavin reductase (DIM6/NTAB) family NADH-FMN oxidoreductase RutF
MVAASLSTQSHTLELIRASNLFSINWMDYSLKGSLDVLGFQSGRGRRNKLAMAGLRDVRSELGVPYIAEAAAHIECDVHSIQAAGDHSMVLGRVLRAEALDEFDEYWAFRSYRPILYLGSGDGHGRYVTLYQGRGGRPTPSGVG